MSAKDSMAKEYFADNARFADLCNNILYGGREVILPENLKERDTTEVLTALGLDKKTIAVQKLRDIFKNASILQVRSDGDFFDPVDAIRLDCD